MNGIDISGWQSGIDLSKVACDFVICKATEGTTVYINDFERQMKQASQLNKLIGAYHYANGGNAAAEADYFVSKVQNWIGKALLCLDWEDGGNASWNSSNEIAWIKEWCERVRSKTGVEPIVYTGASAMSRIKSLGYGLWIAQYPDYEQTGYQAHPWNEGVYECLIRQYSGNGKLDGYSGALDLNKAYITKAEWQKFAGKENDYMILQKGDQNGAVLIYKQGLIALKKAGKITQGVDDNEGFGDGTFIATKQVQEAYNKLYPNKKITVDGIAGEQTFRAMRVLIENISDTTKVKALQVKIDNAKKALS